MRRNTQLPRMSSPPPPLSQSITTHAHSFQIDNDDDDDHDDNNDSSDTGTENKHIVIVIDTEMSTISPSSPPPSSHYTIIIESEDVDNADAETNIYTSTSFDDVNQHVHEKYYDSNVSSELDILITFLRGQKSIFSYASKRAFEIHKRFILSGILLSFFLTIFVPAHTCYTMYCTLFVSILNITLTCSIAVINFMKWEKQGNEFQWISVQYERLENSLEIANHKLCYLENIKEKQESVFAKIHEFEEEILQQINSSNLPLPPVILKRFPFISSFNVFSFIKKMNVYKHELVHSLCETSNNSRMIDTAVLSGPSIPLSDAETRAWYQSKEKVKHKLALKEIKIRDDLVQARASFDYVENVFAREIKNADEDCAFCSYFYCCCQHKIVYEKTNNPILDRHIEFLFKPCVA